MTMLKFTRVTQILRINPVMISGYAIRNTQYAFAPLFRANFRDGHKFVKTKICHQRRQRFGRFRLN